MTGPILLAQATPAPRPIGPPPTPGKGDGSVTPPGPQPGFRPKADVSNNDVLVGGAILLVLGVVFWLAKRALARHLIERRASLDQANRAGLMLWIMLMSLSMTGVCAFVARKALFEKDFAIAILFDTVGTLMMSASFLIFLISLIFFLVYVRSALPR